MLIAVGLSWEALRWDAHRVLRLAWPGAWVGALVLLLGIALVTAIWHFVPAARSSRAADALFREDRRKFVVAALGMLPVVALGTYFGRRLWARAAAEKKWVRLDDLPAGARGGRLVLHRATRTLHHPDACRGHLPGDGVPLSGAQIPEKTRLHPGQEILILQALARDAVRAGRTDEGIQLYQQAIALSPYSYHLYDALAGLYGHLRRYDEIFTLLKGARDRLSVPDAAARDPRAAQRRAKRAITELNTRLAGAECRRTKCNDSLVDESADSKVPAAAAPAKRDAPAAAVAESSKNP
jgi:tetratricopeptide (TPR) repeat protein